MKMGVGTRVIFSIFLLLVIGVCGIIIFAALGGFPEENMMELFRGFTETNFRFIWLGAAAVMLVVAVCLLFFGIRHREIAPVNILLNALADGSVSISIGAMQELIGRYLNTVKGIVPQRIEIRPLSERNIRVNIYLTVRPDISIPDLTKQITSEVREHIMKYSGVNASYVEIMVQPMGGNQQPSFR